MVQKYALSNPQQYILFVNTNSSIKCLINAKLGPCLKLKDIYISKKRNLLYITTKAILST